MREIEGRVYSAGPRNTRQWEPAPAPASFPLREPRAGFIHPARERIYIALYLHRGESKLRAGGKDCLSYLRKPPGIIPIEEYRRSSKKKRIYISDLVSGSFKGWEHSRAEFGLSRLPIHGCNGAPWVQHRVMGYEITWTGRNSRCGRKFLCGWLAVVCWIFDVGFFFCCEGSKVKECVMFFRMTDLI